MCTSKSYSSKLALLGFLVITTLLFGTVAFTQEAMAEKETKGDKTDKETKADKEAKAIKEAKANREFKFETLPPIKCELKNMNGDGTEAGIICTWPDGNPAIVFTPVKVIPFHSQTVKPIKTSNQCKGGTTYDAKSSTCMIPTHQSTPSKCISGSHFDKKSKGCVVNPESTTMTTNATTTNAPTNATTTNPTSNQCNDDSTYDAKTNLCVPNQK